MPQKPSKKHVINWEKIFSMCITDEGLISLIEGGFFTHGGKKS